MTFKQQYQFTEYGLGKTSVRFLVTDKWEDVFKSDIELEQYEYDEQVDGFDVNIFQLQSVKQDLTIESGKYAVDQLNFSINQSSCRTEQDINAMSFCNDAANVNYNRICAVFMLAEGAVPSTDTLLFVGKIDYKISATDKIWSSSKWSGVINPIREYKYTSSTFDISMLEKCKLTERIADYEDNTITNVMTRLLADDTFRTNTFAYRNCYKSTANTQIYHCPTGSLFDIINNYLSIASEVIKELLDLSDFILSFKESSLGIKVAPVEFNLKTDEDGYDTGMLLTDGMGMYVNATTRIELIVRASESEDGKSNPYLHQRMVATAYGARYTDPDIMEKAYSFESKKNVSDILFEIAKDFACYVFSTLKSATEIELELRPRSTLVENEYTYLIGVKDANIDAGSTINEKDNAFYANANNYTMEEWEENNKHWFDASVVSGDIVSPKPGFPNGDLYASKENLSDKTNLVYEQNGINKERDGVDVQKLMLSTSPIYWRFFSTGTYYPVYPLNTTYLYSDDYKGVCFMLFHGALVPLPALERIHTGIYVKNGTDYRFASGIYVKINNVDCYFENLSKYVEYCIKRDRQYYESEYQLTVPFWSGFSKNVDGSDYGWKKLLLGSKIKLTEEVRHYVGHWVDEDVDTDYVVVSKEINLQKPETKIKLHYAGRFAFGFNATAITPKENGYNEQFQPVGTPVIVTQRYVVQIGCTLKKGDAVRILENNKIKKAYSISDDSIFDDDGYVIVAGKQVVGVCLADIVGDGTTQVEVQISGEFINPDYVWNLSGNGFVYCRATDDTPIPNVIDEPLTDKTSDEDSYIVMGKMTGEYSFIIGMGEYIYD
jgi:hypothetical protein